MNTHHSYAYPNERMVGGWQCQHCYRSDMQGWAGTTYPTEEEGDKR